MTTSHRLILFIKIIGRGAARWLWEQIVIWSHIIGALLGLGLVSYWLGVFVISLMTPRDKDITWDMYMMLGMMAFIVLSIISIFLWSPLTRFGNWVLHSWRRSGEVQ